MVLAGGGFGAFAAFQEPTTPQGLSLRGMNLGGLTKAELRQKLETWWATEKTSVIQPKSYLLSKQPAAVSLEEMGVRPDWDASTSKIVFESYTGKLLGNTTMGTELQMVWKLDAGNLGGLASFVKSHARKKQPARVKFSDGVIKRNYEVTSFTLDDAKVGEAALAAVAKGAESFEIPMSMEAPSVPNAALDSITDVVSSYSTSFNLGKANRCDNIRLAASRLNGVIVMPGEIMSYNETVGRRLISEGFKLAGVYKNGKHDTGIGGGVCQVSTTLFNACALANLGIVQRSNHSMPVAYVPLGRDATVDYGSLDLKVRNAMQNPVAIVSEVHGDTLTFRVLGKKDPELKVALVTTDHSSWGRPIQYVTDPTLPAGKTKLVEPGSTGRRCITWRIVKRDGVQVKREKIGVNLYRASPRIIARAPAPLVVAPPPAPAGSPPPEPPE